MILDVGLSLMLSSPCPLMPMVSLAYKSLVLSSVNFVWLTTCTELTDKPSAETDAVKPSHNTNNNRTSANVLFWLIAAIAVIKRIGSKLAQGLLDEPDHRRANEKRPTLTVREYRKLGYKHYHSKSVEHA